MADSVLLRALWRVLLGLFALDPDASFDHSLPGYAVPFHQRLPKPNPSQASPAFYRLRDVIRITALSRTTLYRRISEGRFPAPVHLGGRASGWPAETLQAWIDDPEGYRSPMPQRDSP